jgi:hypothetical protein
MYFNINPIFSKAPQNSYRFRLKCYMNYSLCHAGLRATLPAHIILLFPNTTKYLSENKKFSFYSVRQLPCPSDLS